MWFCVSIMSRKWEVYAKYTSFVYACYPYHGHFYTLVGYKKRLHISFALFIWTHWNHACIIKFFVDLNLTLFERCVKELSSAETIPNQFDFLFGVIINYKVLARKHSIYPVCDAILHPIFGIFILLEKYSKLLFFERTWKKSFDAIHAHQRIMMVAIEYYYTSY